MNRFYDRFDGPKWIDFTGAYYLTDNNVPPLVLYSTGSSLKIGFRPGLIEWVKTLLTNSSRIITCVVFLQFRWNKNGRRWSTRRTSGKEVDSQTYTINSQQTETKFCKNHLRNEAYSIKTANYLTSPIITHNNLNHTQESISLIP